MLAFLSPFTHFFKSRKEIARWDYSHSSHLRIWACREGYRLDVESQIHKIWDGWNNYANRLHEVWGSAILAARTGNILFPLNHVLFIWQEHMSPASPQIFLIYSYETETKTILSTTGNTASWNTGVKQQCWKYHRSWQYRANTWKSFLNSILPKIASVLTLFNHKYHHRSITVGEAEHSGWLLHWGRKLKFNFYCKNPSVAWPWAKPFLSLFTIAFCSSLLCQSDEFASFHKGIISIKFLDISERRGILVLVLITPTESAGAWQQQKLRTCSQKRFVWMQRSVDCKTGDHNLIIFSN